LCKKANAQIGIRLNDKKIYATQCKPPKPCNICTNPSSYNSTYQIPSHSKLLNLILLPMERTPDTSHTLIQTLNRLRDSLERLSARIAKQQGFLQNLVGLHVAHADGFLFAADVFAFHDGVAAGSGGDCDFDLGVLAGESLELGFEEGAGRVSLEIVVGEREENKRTSFLCCYRPSRSSGSRCACIAG
jgi:hypothetical protein